MNWRIVWSLFLYALCGALGAVMLLQGPAAMAEDEVPAEPTVRRFNDVLGDLLNEFSYDLKTNALSMVKTASMRRVSLGETIPKAYEGYLESLVSERIKKFSAVKLIQCANCRVKRTVVENGRLTVTVPINNPKELDALAAQLGLDAWVDAGLLYQETSMIFAVNVFDAKTKELIWTKVYNSENLYKKTMDEEKAKEIANIANPGEKQKAEEPKGSRYVFDVSGGYFMVPNVKTASNMVGATLRVAERFNLGRSEVGTNFSVVADPGLFVQNYDGVEGDPAATGEVQVGTTKETIKPFTLGFAFFGSYYHNFVTDPEDTDRIRYGVHCGLGGVFAKGYITFTGRGGMVMKFGRRFYLDGGLMYSSPTTLKIKNTYTFKTKGGLGADLSFGLLF